jgi:hypothetical protein
MVHRLNGKVIGEDAMNETLLAFMGAVAIYGLSALALPQPSPRDTADQAEIGECDSAPSADSECRDSETG